MCNKLLNSHQIKINKHLLTDVINVKTVGNVKKLGISIYLVKILISQLSEN